ncbi:SPOC like C-terminal domain-containing protein [Gongronella butleri]|nr:SPOC like C-terminal domain-containing protein [Gongronella butleri]
MTNLIQLDQSASSQFLDDYDEEDMQVKDPFFNVVDHIVFAVDCSPTMLEPNDAGEVPIREAFKCIKTVLLNKAYSNTKELVGVVLFNTAKSQNSGGYDNVYMYSPLESSSPERIKAIGQLARDDDTKFERDIGSSSAEFPLGNLFWACSDMFNSVKATQCTRRVFLITNQDNPHANNTSFASSTLQRANDLKSLDTRIELFGLNRGQHTFDVSLFYNDVIKPLVTKDDDSDSTQTQLATVGSVHDLQKQMRRRQNQKRPYFNIPFKIADGLTIGVSGYVVIKQQTRKAHVQVRASESKLQEIETVTTYQCADTGEPLLATDIKYSYPFGDTNALFTKEELLQLRQFGTPGITLLGFKPRSALMPHHNINPNGYFIYPNEKLYEGSTRTFAALLKATLDQDKIAVCHFVPRSNSSPKMAVLIPQAEELEDGAPAVPPGFNIHILPYADDIRFNFPTPDEREPNKKLVATFSAIIEDMTVKGRYDPTQYKNPALQQHYAALQSIALNEPKTTIHDDTLPDTEAIDRVIEAHQPIPF